MAIVPKGPSQRRVGGDVRSNVVTDNSQFARGGANLAEGLGAAGRQLESIRAQATQAALELKAKEDRTVSIDTLTRMDQAMQGEMTKDGGFLSRKGLDAVDVTQDGIVKYDEIGTQFMDGLKNDTQRRSVAEAWSKRRKYTIKALGGHEFAEGEKAQLRSENGFMDNEGVRMVLNAHDDAAVLDASRNITNTLTAQAEREGMDAEATEAHVRDGASPHWRNWLLERSQNDPIGTRAIFESDGVQVLMHEADRLAVEEQLGYDTDAAVTQEVAKRVREIPGSARDKVKQFVDNDDRLTPAQKDEAKRRIYADEQIDQQADKDLRVEVVREVTEQGMADVDKLLAAGASAESIQSMYDVTMRNLPDVASRNNFKQWFGITVQGDTVQTNWTVYNELRNMSAAEWRQSGKDVMDFAAQLHADERKQLINHRASVIEGSLPEDSQNTTAMLQTFYDDVGWGSSEGDRAKKGRLQQVVHSRIDALAALKKRTVTGPEKLDIINRATEERKVPGKYWGTLWRSTVRRYKETPQEHIQRQPTAMRILAADAAARSTGLPNADPKVVSAYAAALTRLKEQTINSLPQHKRAAAKMQFDADDAERSAAIIESGMLSRGMIELIGVE